MFNNLFSPLGQGRLSRGQYFITLIGSFFMSAFIPVVGPLVGTVISFLGASKRLHDLGYSGKFALMSFIPIANFILWFLLLFREGEYGANQYGMSADASSSSGSDLGRNRNAQPENRQMLNRMMRGAHFAPRGFGIFGMLLNAFNGRAKSSMQNYYKRSKKMANGATSPADFIFSLLMMSTFVIKHDKKIDEKELEFTFAFLKKHFSLEQAQAGMDLLEQLLKEDWDMNSITRQVNESFNYTTKLYLMQFLFGIAYSDSRFNEGAVLKRISFKIGVDDKDFLDMQRFWKMNDVESASEEAFQANLDGAQWDEEDLKERMELMMAKLDPERVIEFGDKVVEKAKKDKDDVFKSFKRKFPSQMNLEQRLAVLPDDRGLRQYKELRQRLANFLDVLSRKMNVDEMTYKRYKTIAEEVYKSAIKNLEHVANTVYLIDTEDMESMRTQAETSGTQEKSTINKRLEMYEKEMNSIKEIYIENEEAITQMDEAIFSLNNIETSTVKEETLDMKTSMAELEEWTKRVKLYEVSN